MVYLWHRIRRSLFHRSKEIRIIERAKLKMDMGLNLTQKELGVVRFFIDKTITNRRLDDK